MQRIRSRPGVAAGGEAGHTASMSPLSRAQSIRRLANLVNLSTPLGLAIATAGRATRRPGPNGLTLAEGYTIPFPPAGAFTVGNVVISPVTFEELIGRNPTVMEHEDVHAWQYCWCAGLPFLPLYVLAAGWSWLRTGDVASGNVFERGAGLARGGYTEAPVSNAGFRLLTERIQTLTLNPSRLAERSR